MKFIGDCLGDIDACIIRNHILKRSATASDFKALFVMQLKFVNKSLQYGIERMVFGLFCNGIAAGGLLLIVESFELVGHRILR